MSDAREDALAEYLWESEPQASRSMVERQAFRAGWNAAMKLAESNNEWSREHFAAFESELREERNRYREALEEIAEKCSEERGSRFTRIWHIATSALEGKP